MPRTQVPRTPPGFPAQAARVNLVLAIGVSSTWSVIGIAEQRHAPNRTSS